MEFYDVIKKRHSVRAFENKDIEKEKLTKIISAVSLAPSAGNLQAYQVYIVRTKKVREELSLACLGQESVAEAPVVLVFCADQQQSASKYGERGAQFYSMQDATIAAAYSQLSASAEGLGSVWIGAFDPLEVSRVLNVDAYTVPVAVIPIGYPGELPKGRDRRDLNELIIEV